MASTEPLLSKDEKASPDYDAVKATGGDGAPTSSSTPRADEQAWHSFRWSQLHVHQLVEGHFFSPRTVFFIRLFNWLFITVVLLTTLSIFWSNGRWWFFFTNLTYLGLFLWLTIGLILSFWHNFVEPLPHDLGCHEEGRHRFSAVHLIHVLANIQPQAHLIVLLVFWLLLFPGIDFGTRDETERFTLISQHGIEFLVATVDWLLVSVPVPSLIHGVFLYVVFLLYMVYTWILHAILAQNGENYWVYDFLEFGTTLAAITYPGLVIFIGIVAFGFFYAARLRSNGRKVLSIVPGQGGRASAV